METKIATVNKLNWPPQYNLRISKKARNVQLKIIPNQGLEIVIPIKKQKSIVITELLSEKRSWIEKHLSNITVKPIELINQLVLHAIDQTWHIEYKQTTKKTIHGIIHPGNNVHTIVLHGNITDIVQIQHWLKAWLKDLAKEHLLPWLYALSIEHGLLYNRANIRAQQTLWGSCTVEKNISLNYKLLFVPPTYAQHIMLHELCHLKHLNHSKNFWALLARLDTNYKAHNLALRNADQYIPLLLN